MALENLTDAEVDDLIAKRKARETTDVDTDTDTDTDVDTDTDTDEGKEKKTDEKPKVNDEAAKLLKEVMKLKQKLKDEEKARKDAESKFGDIDVEAAREALRKAEEAETKELERKGEYDRLLKKVTDAHAAEKTALQKQIEDLAAEKTAFVRQMEDLTVGNAFANSKFISDNMTLTPAKTRVLFGEYFEVQDGQVIAYDAPKSNANRTPIVDGSGNPVPFEIALKTIIEADPDKDTLLKAQTKAGAGSKPATHTAPKREDTYIDNVDKLAAGVAQFFGKK